MTVPARSLPTVSYSLYQTSPEAFIHQLRDALLSHGFLYLDDIASSLPSWTESWDQAFAVSSAFFQLPVEEKENIAMLESKHFRGYSGFKVEVTAGKKDLREQIDFGPETPPHPESSSNLYLSLYGPNLFPTSSQVPTFRTSILSFRSQLHQIAQTLLHAIALSITSRPDLIEQAWYPRSDSDRDRKMAEFEPDYSRMKIVSYPVVKREEQHEGALGVGAHKDGGGLTLLAQDQTGGLQVQAWDGVWIDVTPKKYALVINIGQVLERLTVGIYSATTHRVLPTLGTQPRLSIPLFFSPTLQAHLTPLDPVQDLHPSEKVSEVKQNDLHEEVFGKMAWRGISRSHGDVWERWYGKEVDPVGGPEVDVAV
ncbi:BQ2448_5874 [Microbotryum intermedium]|uniref:BQ2448_5874 protein n=1 Tax=Microbotryum intermedium TaxID=269621 RepID=A0A238F7S7_9BASI|nr:BQ2448_5874 [Microbotryum intermedium]